MPYTARTPLNLVDTARSIADRTAKTLMLKYKCLLAEGSLCRKPHFAIDDPVAEFVSRYFEISTPESKIDRSEGPGEIDFFGAKNAVDYLRLPERVNEMADKLEVMSCDMTEIRGDFGATCWYSWQEVSKERPFDTVTKGLGNKQIAFLNTGF